MPSNAMIHGLDLIHNYYTEEAISEMKKDFHKMDLPESDFPKYVAYCYEIDNNPADNTCW